MNGARDSLRGDVVVFVYIRIRVVLVHNLCRVSCVRFLCTLIGQLEPLEVWERVEESFLWWKDFLKYFRRLQDDIVVVDEKRLRYDDAIDGK